MKLLVAGDSRCPWRALGPAIERLSERHQVTCFDFMDEPSWRPSTPSEAKVREYFGDQWHGEIDAKFKLPSAVLTTEAIATPETSHPFAESDLLIARLSELSSAEVQKLSSTFQGGEVEKTTPQLFPSGRETSTTTFCWNAAGETVSHNGTSR